MLWFYSSGSGSGSGSAQNTFNQELNQLMESMSKSEKSGRSKGEGVGGMVVWRDFSLIPATHDKFCSPAFLLTSFEWEPCSSHSLVLTSDVNKEV